ncbi:MAG TPA: Stk1 family PASTA domain-containing Ser/Thr kinase [Candidatus Limnocylindrales bacterium]|nr:Stk1 family PASTA domain-containing Ser/Thr kinase [Candidatus Limnocylindrales bacterium]
MAEVGQVLAGRYRLVELLGQGGMATIFRGHDGQLGRDVAVKVLRAEYGRDPAFVARFRQEAQSAAALSHPNVVNVFDYGMEAGDPFIVMEMIDGGDLGAVIKERGTLEPLAAARIAQQIFEALDTAHARGIVHRDIKPTNVLLTSSGRVKVADFGIARAFSEAQLTMPGTTLGSVHYFSPEQARGEMVTSASDVYSAGLVLFEMLTGRRAWTGDSAGAVAVARLAGDPPSPSDIQPGVPEVLDTAVRRSLARLPADRPTAGDMAALLGRYIADPSAVAVASAGTAVAGTAAAGAAGIGAAAAATAGSADAPPGYPGYPAASPPGAYGTPYGQMAYPSDADDEPGGTSPWGWIAALLAVLLLLAGGGLLFVLLSGRGPAIPTAQPSFGFVAMPNFVGQLLADAESTAEEQGLVLTVGAYVVNDEAPEGTIVDQSPAAGGQVRIGSRVSVNVATQGETVPVPDVRMRTEAEFFAILAQNNLAPGQRAEGYDPEVPASLIVRTNPRQGVEVARGTSIDYVVSLGPMPTPTPSPLPTDIPLTPPPTDPQPTDPPTEPPTAAPTPSPTPSPEPTPTPAPTPAPVPVGNYVLPFLADLGQAQAQIVTDGLQVGVVWPSDAAADWIVCIQYPAAGELVPPGTLVHLFVKPPFDAC